MADGDVLYWGDNDSGQLNDSTTDQATPVAVEAVDTCALMRNGDVQCWKAFDQIVVNHARGDREPSDY